MTIKTDHDALAMRQRAEARLPSQSAPVADEAHALSPVEVQHALHELRVHQIELEMQNEELRRAKDELEVSKALYFDLYDLAPVGYCTLSEYGLILQANLTMATLLGVARGSLIKKPISTFIFSQDQDIYYRARARTVNTGQRHACELRMTKADGSLLWIRLEATVTQDANDGVRLRTVISDIAERRRAQVEVLEHQQHLERLVLSRTAELEQARDAAEAANRAKSAFLSTMSHELRTPLNAVVGLTGLLAQSALGRRQRNYVEKIQLSAKMLRLLIDDILDFSRIEAGDLTLEQAEFSLASILRTVAVFIGEGLGAKPIEVVFDVAHDIPDALVGDALRLQQVLLNLTSNALKFTEAGVIVVSLRCLGRQADQATLQFSVRDTGMGIADEHLVRIFDSFTQADTSISRTHGGSGLGLSICARLARLMQGRVDVESAPGRGSEFRLTVPMALGSVEKPAVVAEHLRGLKILIVDDHTLAREMLTQACRSFGWQVTALDSGAAGLAELRRSTVGACGYDLMLLDWHMPAMDGLDMLRQAYATPGVGLPLVVLMAALTELEQAVLASDDLDLDGIATKPITPACLLKAVGQAYAGEYVPALPAANTIDRRLGGMRLLVAEDNDLNQEVIEQVLTLAGAEVVVVADGALAVAALREPGAHFDAVLMDIHMPVMDGYTATRFIRDELGRTDLPIIAVTAFARPEDLEKSRLAGMVAHLVKPLDVEDLLDVLVRERPPPGRNPNARSHTLANGGVPATELAGLGLAAALRDFGGDKKTYQKLLAKFVAQHGGDVEQAHALLRAEDITGALFLVHRLGGMAGVLRAMDLGRLAEAIELTVLNGNLLALPGLFTQLEDAMRTVTDSSKRLDIAYADA